MWHHVEYINQNIIMETGTPVEVVIIILSIKNHVKSISKNPTIQGYLQSKNWIHCKEEGGNVIQGGGIQEKNG